MLSCHNIGLLCTHIPWRLKTYNLGEDLKFLIASLSYYLSTHDCNPTKRAKENCVSLLLNPVGDESARGKGLKWEQEMIKKNKTESHEPVSVLSDRKKKKNKCQEFQKSK